MQIRNDIRRTLALNLDDSQLILAGERIGAVILRWVGGQVREFDEEIDRVSRRREIRD